MQSRELTWVFLMEELLQDSRMLMIGFLLYLFSRVSSDFTFRHCGFLRLPNFSIRR